VSEASVKQGSHLDEAVDDGQGVELGSLLTMSWPSEARGSQGYKTFFGCF
jgi:hypothetical protein